MKKERTFTENERSFFAGSVNQFPLAERWQKTGAIGKEKEEERRERGEGRGRRWEKRGSIDVESCEARLYKKATSDIGKKGYPIERK